MPKDERDKFLATCKGVQTIIWTLFLKCGLRLKELSYLEWTDIDFIRHIVRIRRKKVKNGNSVVDFIPKKWSIRDVAIPTDLLMLLEQQQAKSSSNLCFSTRTGRINTKLWDQCEKDTRKNRCSSRSMACCMRFNANRKLRSTVLEGHANHRALLGTRTTLFTKLHASIRS